MCIRCLLFNNHNSNNSIQQSPPPYLNTAPPLFDAPPTSHTPPILWLYTPLLASSTAFSLSSFTARVLPSDVTAPPTLSTPAAKNAAMLSVVPAHTVQSADRPVWWCVWGVIWLIGEPGERVVLGRYWLSLVEESQGGKEGEGGEGSKPSLRALL